MGDKLGSFLRVLGSGLSKQAFQANVGMYQQEQAEEASVEKINIAQMFKTMGPLGVALKNAKASKDMNAVAEITKEMARVADQYPKYANTIKSSVLAGEWETAKSAKGSHIQVTMPGREGVFSAIEDSQGRIVDSVTREHLPNAIRAPSQRQEGKIPATAKQKMDALGSNVSEMEFIGNEIISKMKENPNILGVAGGLSRLTDSMKEQAIGLAQEVFDIEVTASQDINQYDWSKVPAAAKSAEMQTNLLNLAMAAAASKGQSGKSLSDKDLQREIEAIGGGAGSRTQLEARIKATIRSGKRRYITSYKQTHGKSPSMSIFKRSDVGQGNPEKEAEIDNQLQETRKLLDAMKKKYKVD